MTTDHLAAISAGETHRVIAYIEAGGDANSRGAHAIPLLAWCAHHGDVTAIEFLISRGARIQDLGDNLDLHGAAFHGHDALVRWCLDHGADPSYQIPATGETPMHAALCRANRPNHTRIIAKLVSAGARLDAKTVTGAPLDSFMRDVRGQGETALHRAAAYADGSTIDILLGAGASREAVDAAGNTPLSWASWHLRPDDILRRLCFGEHRIHPDRAGSYDHGTGWTHDEQTG